MIKKIIFLLLAAIQPVIAWALYTIWYPISVPSTSDFGLGLALVFSMMSVMIVCVFAAFWKEIFEDNK